MRRKEYKRRVRESWEEIGCQKSSIACLRKYNFEETYSASCFAYLPLELDIMTHFFDGTEEKMRWEDAKRKNMIGGKDMTKRDLGEEIRVWWNSTYRFFRCVKLLSIKRTDQSVHLVSNILIYIYFVIESRIHPDVYLRGRSKITSNCQGGHILWRFVTKGEGVNRECETTHGKYKCE